MGFGESRQREHAGLCKDGLSLVDFVKVVAPKVTDQHQSKITTLEYQAKKGENTWFN